MTTTRTDPTDLRAAAEAQLGRLDGPLWAASVAGGDDEGDWIAAPGAAGTGGPTAVAARTASPARPTKASRKKKPSSTATSRSKRGPGRPASEVPRLPTREVRIPVVVDERMRELAAWAGVEPIQALWLLSTMGWESWQKGSGAGTGGTPQ